MYRVQVNVTEVKLVPLVCHALLLSQTLTALRGQTVAQSAA